MGNRLYVGNLPFSVDETSLRSLFEQNERMVEEVKMITDRDTGRPRGFGRPATGSRPWVSLRCAPPTGRILSPCHQMVPLHIRSS